jgi:hypothetical protein
MVQDKVLVYDRIGANRRNTVLLLAVFIVIVGGFLVALGILLGLPAPYAPFLIVPAILYALFSYYASTSVTLAISQAHAVTKEQEPDYYRTVENLCIGAGLPMPKLYVIEDSAPNAFATGRSPNNAVICVTRGLLQKMDHLELEGVVAHELSHIGNYDPAGDNGCCAGRSRGAPGRLHVAVHDLGRRRSDGQSRPQRRLGGDHHLRLRSPGGDPGADSGAAHPTCVVATARVPG